MQHVRSSPTRSVGAHAHYVYGLFAERTARLRLKRKHPRQNSTVRRCNTACTQKRHKHRQAQRRHEHKCVTRRLPRRQEPKEREQKIDRLHPRKRGPRGRQWTGPVADERPRGAECDRPYGEQRPEHLQGQCARGAERKTIHDADTIPRNRARDQGRQRRRRTNSPWRRPDVDIIKGKKALLWLWK
jgi:hypothetical protein